LIDTLVVLTPAPPDNRSLLDTVLDELSKMGVGVVKLSFLDESQRVNLGAVRNELDLLGVVPKNILILDWGRLPAKRLRALFPGAKLVLFAADTPQTINGDSWLRLFMSWLKHQFLGRVALPYGLNYGVRRCAIHYDLSICSDRGAALHLGQTGRNAVWMPYWFDSILSGESSAKSPEFDLVSVMTPRRERAALLNALHRAEGIEFKNFSGITGSDVFESYASGKIVLNHAQYGEVTIRVFEALGL
jgi:hypothetical protein